MFENFVWWGFFTLKKFESAFTLLRDNLSFWNPIRWGATVWIMYLEFIFFALSPYKLTPPSFIEERGVFWV